ncbi:MAG: 23S rRNA (adenine(2503)-C(2))-methyltransferase RlmN [Nitrosomonadales bacterium]
MNIFDLNFNQLKTTIAESGHQPFRAKQLWRWLYKEEVIDFDQMTDLAKDFREFLKKTFQFSFPEVDFDHLSQDGTRKWLFNVGEANAIESVFIPEKNRGTLCVSSQVGCALECTFCSTGRQGFNRNLTQAEIISQLWLANHMLTGVYPERLKAVTNVVMMGMGEPLANYQNVVSALDIMLSDQAYGLSRRRVTVSTSGLIPAILKLKEDCPVSLAVSLHAPNNQIRDEIVPINKKYPIEDLIDACRSYLEHAPRDFITFEYVMLKGINDSELHAKELVKLTKKIHCKFNLIPFNPFPKSGYESSSLDQIKLFQKVLMENNIVTTIRKTRGDDIDAACGQLAGNVKDKTKRVVRLIEKGLR